MQNIELITPAMLSEKLNIKTSTVNNWIKNKKIPEKLYLKIGTVIRIHKKRFEEFYDVNLSDLITIQEMAEILGTNINTVKSWFFRKEIPAILKCKIVGITRIKKSLLLQFVNGDSEIKAA